MTNFVIDFVAKSKKTSEDKEKVKDIFSLDNFEEMKNLGELPDDTSIVFFVLKKATH